jgi:hypothetical protein
MSRLPAEGQLRLGAEALAYLIGASVFEIT